MNYSFEIARKLLLVEPNITWQYNTKTDVRETGCEFTGIIMLRIGSYHDLLRAGKYIFQLHKSNDELQDCRLPKNDRTPQSKDCIQYEKVFLVSIGVYLRGARSSLTAVC